MAPSIDTSLRASKMESTMSPIAMSPLHLSNSLQDSPRMDKTLGEFSTLPQHYDGSYKPARMGLRRVLEAGRMRNPLEMRQSHSGWVERRPLSASGAKARPASPRQPLSGRATTDFTDKVAANTSTAAAGAGVAYRPPGMLQPQRIELPGYLNTPARRPDGEPLLPEERTTSLRKIKDLEMLTFACRRASKLREEGRAHFSLGVLRDNLGQYQKAIEAYTQFLRVCKECNDGQGAALGYHCIAVDYQLQGNGVSKGGESEEPQSGASATVGPPASERAVRPELLRKAIHYHNRHRENADSIGKFVAHLNMGLAYAQLGEREASTVNHQYALRYALQLHSLEGQSLAIGSLSFSAGMYDQEPEKMKILVERYVDLCATLKQTRNQAIALKKLGILASQQGQNEQSVEYFQRAIECAREQGDHEAEKDCAVRLGIAAGQAKMAEHLSNILQRSVIGSD
ncbi:unnamed protein product [Effrenium voratum]|uniref:Tetratricopeptide repeat protein 29 n=1 Tax=Effrenium voratum TaxID=2562239 RepID=A0AA36JRM7_9DINO|nr:unnamed protein product [Effrenium voratum]CAJ1411130.1 unnamed protein product [Effrenium voratum]CAJ1427496.1 unnamed protein product [Effrenium voratum]